MINTFAPSTDTANFPALERLAATPVSERGFSTNELLRLAIAHKLPDEKLLTLYDMALTRTEDEL